MSVKETIKNILVNKLNRRYDKSLGVKKISYDAYARESAFTKKLQTGTEDDFVVLLMDGATLRDGAMQEIAKYMKENPLVMLAYGDEDVLEEGEYHTPWYKPSWSPDLYLETFYFGNAIVLRKPMLKLLGATVGRTAEDGVIYFHDLWQLRSIVDRLVYELGGYEKGCAGIGHIPGELCSVASEKMQKACSIIPFGKES